MPIRVNVILQNNAKISQSAREMKTGSFDQKRVKFLSFVKVIRDITDSWKTIWLMTGLGACIALLTLLLLFVFAPVKVFIPPY